MGPPSQEWARFLRLAEIPGVEVLHARFVEHRYPPHVHDTLTVAHVTHGAAAFDLERRLHFAPAGSVFVIPAHAVHTGRAATAAGYSYLVLYLDPARLAWLGDDQATAHPTRSPTVIASRQLARTVELVHHSLVQRCAALEQQETLTALLCQLQLRPTRLMRPEHAAVRAARGYIQEHYQQNFTLQQLATATYLSPFHLARTFHDQVGMPPSAYRRALRVQAAQRLLRRGATPARAAMECGFYDQAHLNLHFKRITGVTPSQYATANS